MLIEFAGTGLPHSSPNAVTACFAVQSGSMSRHGTHGPAQTMPGDVRGPLSPGVAGDAMNA